MRRCPDALKKYFDQHIPDGPYTDVSALLIAAATSCVGITEVGEDNAGPLVELFQSAISRPVHQSWCLDFIQACIAYVEASKSILSPLPATEHVLTLWDQAKGYHAVSPPKPGDLILWRMGDTSSGHVGLILGQDSLRYQTVEGNTSPSGEIERNGDGVYLKNRAKGGSKTFQEVGFLRVFPQWTGP